jgi:O-antigen/teichoic acid export membrane protein
MAEETQIMQVADRSAHGIMHLFWGNTLSTVIMTICTIIVGRLLGPADYGLYSLAIVVPNLLIGLIDFGITSAITRFSAKFRAEGRDSDVRKVVWTGILFELIIGIIASLFCFAFSYSLSIVVINRPEASFYVRAASFLILFLTFNNVLSAAFIGLNMMKVNSIVMTIQAFAKLVLAPLLIIAGLGIFGAVLGQVVSYVIAIAVGIASLSFMLYEGHDDYGLSSDIFKDMLKYGMPLYLSGVVGLFLVPYQTIILAYFTTNAEIGNFQVAMLFQNATALISYPFISLFPAFSTLDAQDRQIGPFFRRSVKYTAALLIPAAVAIAVLSKDLIYVLFGSAYTLASTFLAFYVLLNLYAGLGSGVFSYLFSGIGRTDVALKSSLIYFFVFLPLAPLLTLSFGVMGLIASLFISSFCSLPYYLVMARKQIKTGPDLRTSAKIFAVTVLCAVVLIAFLQASPFSSISNLIFGAIIFLFAYLTLLPVLGALTTTDMEIFKQMFYKIKGVRFILKLFILYETKILDTNIVIKTKLARALR